MHPATTDPKSNFLSFIKADQLREGRKVEIVKIPADATIQGALKILHASKVYSAPIGVEDIKASVKYRGSVSMAAINRFIIDAFVTIAGAKPTDKPAVKIAALAKKGFKKSDVESVQALLSKTPAATIIDSEWKPLHDKATLKEVINDLTINERSIIINDSREIVDIISQHLIIKFLAKNVGAFKVPPQSIKELKCFSSPVVTVVSTDSALVTFAHMALEGYSSMGISDKHNIVGIVSLKDLAIVEGDLSRLLHPIGKFVSEVRLSTTEDIYPTVNISSAEDLTKVIQKLAVVGIHRLFIKEKNATDEPFIGIISLSNVLRVLATASG